MAVILLKNNFKFNAAEQLQNAIANILGSIPLATGTYSANLTTDTLFYSDQIPQDRLNIFKTAYLNQPLGNGVSILVDFIVIVIPESSKALITTQLIQALQQAV